MTVLKGFEPLPDPLDLESFKRLTDPDARKRFREKFMAADERTKAATLKALKDGVTRSTPETEAIIDKSEAFARKNGWNGWESDIPHDGPCAIFATNVPPGKESE